MTRIKPSMHDSNILDGTYNINMISENIIIKQIWSQNMYCAGAAGKTKGTDEMKTVLRTECSNRRCRRRYAAVPDLGGGRVVEKNICNRAWRFPKTWFVLSRCRITGANGSGDLLSRSSVHVDARDGASYEDGAAARRGKTLTRLDCVLVEADRSNILKRPTSCRGRILKN